MPARAPLFFLAVFSCFAQSAGFQWVEGVGGSSSASVAGVATDSQGNVYVAGSTTSADLATHGAAQAHPGGGGLFRIDGPGSNWSNLYNSGASAISWLAASVQHPQTVFAVGPQGIFRTTDGATWTVPVKGPVSSVAVDPTNDALIYAFGNSTFFMSEDSGVTWQGVASGPPGIAGRIWVDPNQPQVLFVAESGSLQRNAARGHVGWQGIATSAGPLSMAFDPFTKGTIYAATPTILQVSTDDGLTWSSLGQLNSNYPAQYVLADPLHQGTLYAGSYGGLFRSLDSGATWTQIGSDTNVGPLAADAATGAIYAAIGGTIFKSTDGFATRSVIGPPSQQTVALAVAGSSVYAGVAATSDVFVAKLDAQGNTIYSTYFGGSGSDVAQGIAVDSLGAVYVTGSTFSIDFPVTPGAFAKSGATFLFKLNPDGSTAYSTYFSDGRSQPNAIAVDSSGHAYLAGTSQGGLPVTPGAYQTQFQGVFPMGFFLALGPPPPTNGFITKFGADGKSLIYSTYFGNQNGTASALALAPDGSAIAADGFSLYRIDATGAALLGTKTLAGNVSSVAADSAGNVYAAGGSGSAPISGTPGAFQAAPVNIPSLPGTQGNTGAGDAFVTKLDLQFNVAASTLLGGEAPDQAQAVAIAPNGNVIVGGSTYSKGFPTRGAAQSSFSAQTAFLAELTPDLSALQFSTFAGDTRTFTVFSVAPALDGGAIFGGTTIIPPFPDPYNPIKLAVPNASQAFVVRTAVAAQSAPRIDAVVNAASHLGVGLSPGETFAVTGAGFDADTAVQVNGAALPLISRSSTTLITAIPLDFVSPAAATVTVQTGGATASILTPFVNASPGVFSADGSGLGQGYILNADGSLNSPSNPALEGAEITLFVTGVGPMTFSGPYAVTAAPVTVDIDGFGAPGIAAILVPVAGLPGNVYQISVYVPQPSLYANQNPNLKDFHLPPQVALTFLVNGAKSQAGVAISVTH